MWLLDVDRSSASRLTFVWGQIQVRFGLQIAKLWLLTRSLIGIYFGKMPDGSTSEQRLDYWRRGRRVPYDWSRDGRFLLYSERGDLLVAPVRPASLSRQTDDLLHHEALSRHRSSILAGVKSTLDCVPIQ